MLCLYDPTGNISPLLRSRPEDYFPALSLPMTETRDISKPECVGQLSENGLYVILAATHDTLQTIPHPGEKLRV